MPQYLQYTTHVSETKEANRRNKVVKVKYQHNRTKLLIKNLEDEDTIKIAKELELC